MLHWTQDSVAGIVSRPSLSEAQTASMIVLIVPVSPG